jgi:hypothetical protein
MAAFLSDAFTDTNGTALTAHTPTGAGGTWVEHGSYTSGHLAISPANTVRGDGAALGLCYNDATPPSARYYVEAVIDVISTAAANYPGVIGRVSSSADTMYRGYYDQPNGRWVLDKVVNGAAAQVLGTYTHTPSDATPYTLRLRMVDSDISLWLDGVEVVPAVSDSSISDAGFAGVFSLSAAFQEITSVTAEEIAGGGGGGGGTSANLLLLGVG